MCVCVCPGACGWWCYRTTLALDSVFYFSAASNICTKLGDLEICRKNTPPIDTLHNSSSCWLLFLSVFGGELNG